MFFLAAPHAPRDSHVPVVLDLRASLHPQVLAEAVLTARDHVSGLGLLPRAPTDALLWLTDFRVLNMNFEFKFSWPMQRRILQSSRAPAGK